MEKGGSHTKHLVVGQENLKHGRTAALLDDQQSAALAGSTQNIEAHESNVQPETKTSDSGSSEKVYYEHVPSFVVTPDPTAGVADSRSPHPWPQALGKRNPQFESFDSMTTSSHHELTTKYSGSLGAKEHQLTGSTSLPSMSSATHPVAISSAGHQNNNNIDKTDTIQNTGQRTAQAPQTGKRLLPSGPTQLYSFNIATTSGEKPNPSHPSTVYTSQGNPQTVAHTPLGHSQAAPHSSHESAENRARNYTGSGQPAPTLTVFTTAQSLTSLQVSDEYSRNTRTGVSSDSYQVNPAETEECSYQYLNSSLGFGKKTMANHDMVKYSEKTYENLQFKSGAGRSATMRTESFLNNFDSSDGSTTRDESFHVHGENSSSSEAHHFVSNQSNQQHAKPKKPRSRGSKKKNAVEKLPAESINDEDDDNDFIPVGMLQLSTAKRPESLDSGFQAAKSIGSGIPGGSLQFNQGLQIQYQTGSVQIKSDPGVSQYEAAVHENNILLQQELQNQQRLQEQQNQQRLQEQQNQQQLQEQQNQQRLQDQKSFQKQHQPGNGTANKPSPGSQINPHQTGSQNEPLAQNVAAQQETEQRQQQYLLKLVQQAQQQQKQLLVQQQMSSASGASRSKAPSFHKNQGLIIHHQQQGVGLNSAAQGISQDQKSNQIKESQQLVRDDKTAQISQQGIKEPAKNTSLERYPSNEQQALFQRLQQQGTGLSVLEPSPQAPGSGVTRLTEHLLQQNKEGQDSLIRQNIISRRDQSSLRSVTPTLVHHNPPLNQQHPEIAKMLNSPVSPRQPGSPRQSVSPRRTISPHPSSISPCHFVSPYPRQTNSPRQSSKQAVPHSPAVRHNASPQPKQPLSPRQPTSPWQPVSPSQPAPASPSLQQPQAKTGQTVASYLLSDHKPLQHQKYNQSPIGQPVTINLEKLRSSGDSGLGIGTHPDQLEDIGSTPGPQMTLSQQHLPEKAPSITELHHLPIPSSQPAEVFSPGQIIHHRPQEQKKSRHGHSQGKSRSPGGIMNRLATPSRVSSNVPVPSAENASTIWQQMQPRGNKSHTQVQDSTAHLLSVESNPRSPKPMGSRPQLVDVQDFVLQPIPGLQADNRLLDKPAYDQFSQQQYRSEEMCAPAGDTPHQHSSSDKPGVEMQLCPPAPIIYQAQNLARDTKSVVNSLNIQPSQDFQPQCLTGLSEKETSLIKSLFADNSTHDSRQPTNSQAYSENQSTILSDRSRNDDRLKFLSEIASELAGAGKEETVASQGLGLQDKSSENLTGSFTTEENVESKSLMKVNDQSIKTGSVVLDCVIEVANVQNSDRTKEESLVKESEVAKDLPRREVRQRKPKKPFEQEDTPTRRNTKAVTPSQKNSSGHSGHKKPNPLQTPPTKRAIKQQGKVNPDTEELDKKLKEADPVIQGSAAQKQEKLSEDKFVSHEEESETDSTTDNRRLSRRLRVKEQEINKSDADASNRRSKRRSTRIDYKEEASDSVEENPSNRGRKISPSYSSSEDTAAEGKPRMTTRSKNRKEEPSEKTPNAKQNKEGDNEEKPTSKKRKDDAPEDTTIHRTRRNDQSREKNPATIKSNSRSSTPGPNTKTNPTARKANSVPQANRPAPRDRLRSPASRSRSPVTSRSTTPDNAGTATGHRMTTRRLVAESDNSQVGSGSKSKKVTPSELTEELPSLAAKPKRVAPLEFVDEHPVLRKRTKKAETKSSADSQAQNNQVETQGDMTESSEPVPAIANSVAHVAAGQGSQKLDSKKRSHKRKKRPIRTKPTINALPAGANHQENNVEMKEDEKAKDSKSDLGSADGTTQEISNKQENKDVLPHVEVLSSQGDKAKQESRSGSVQETETNNDGKPEAMSDHSDTPAQGTSAHETPAQETPELRTKQMESLDIKTKLRNRVVESSARNASKQNGESTVMSSGLNSAGASSSLSSQTDLKSRVDQAQPQRDSGLTTVNVENVRQKMVMYKLVPVLGEDVSDLEEGLVPISGFFVSRGTYDRILLPHNFMLGSPTSKMSSAPIDKKSNSSPVSSSWSHQASDNISARKYGLVSDAPLKPVPRSNQAPAQSSSSGLLQSSPWMDQSPQLVATPPPSTGDSMTKKNWSTPQPQASPAYRRSPSWNATPPSILSSSPLSSSSSAWTLSSTSAVASAQPSHSWSGPPHSTPQDPTWRLSPSVNNAAVESWGKDYFPNPSLTDSRRQAQELTSQIDSTVQNISGHQHYGSMEPPLYSAQHDEPLPTNNTSYGTGSQQDSDFAESRQESLIQGFLRQVSANTPNFNQELSSFNLGQQDFAYLERGLRQALSPTALLSAVEAYDGSGQEAGACQDSSLQDSINLVHTVNLDMEEGNLDTSSNLGLVNLSGHSVSQANIPSSMDSLPKTSHSGMQSLMDSELGSSALNDSASSVDGSSLVGSPLAKGITDGQEKKDEKKAMKERKHQYDVVINNGERKFKCKVCNKIFGKTTIYRHLRIHDSDYKISCTLCEKQYTQKNSLMLHMQKFHGEVNTNILSPDKKDPGDVAVKEQDKTSPNNNKPSEAKRQRRSSSTADPLAASLDENELLKQKETHRQVEELRRLKAEKKAHGKTGLHSAEDSSTRDDVLSPSKEIDGEFPIKDFGTGKVASAGYQANNSDYPGTMPDRPGNDHSKSFSSGSLGQMPSGSKSQFQLNSPLPVMSTIAPFQTIDTAMKPTPPPARGATDDVPNNWDRASDVGPEKSSLSQADLKNFFCTACNTQLFSRNGFMLHTRRHKVAKSKLCTSCDKKFHTTTELKTHMRTHTGERPFKCEICYMSFAHSGSFVCHKKGHTNRGELEPFPIIDGQIKYPSTFRKPRTEGTKKVQRVAGDQTKKTKKKGTNESQVVRGNDISSEELSAAPTQDILPGGRHTSIIRKNSLDASFEISARNDSDVQRKISLNRQEMNSSGDGVMGLGDQIFNPNVPPSSHGKEGGGYLQTGDITPGYSTPRHSIPSAYSTTGTDVTGGYSTSSQVDYYSGQSGYSESSQPRNFLSPQVETTSSSHSYYNQDKYYARAASVDQFSPGNSNSQLRSVPVNLVVDKSQHYGEDMQGEYPQNVETDDSYYSTQQPYQYAMPPGGVDGDYEQEDYDGALSQYKGDPSSSEIVKKLLQHYNVPSSTYQEAAPLDYSHQLQGAPDYARTGRETAPPMYAEQDLGVAAPPSYSASVQQKQFYAGHTNTPEYDSSLIMSSDRTGHLPSPQATQERSYSQSTTSIQLSEAYRYSTADSFHEGQYTRSPSQSYTQTYEVTSRDYYQQGLPKIESLARDADPNSRDPITKSQ